MYTAPITRAEKHAAAARSLSRAKIMRKQTLSKLMHHGRTVTTPNPKLMQRLIAAADRAAEVVAHAKRDRAAKKAERAALPVAIVKR